MNVLGYDPRSRWKRHGACPRSEEGELDRGDPEGSQFVTLHVPLLPVTKHLINAKNLGLMHPGRSC